MSGGDDGRRPDISSVLLRDDRLRAGIGRRIAQHRAKAGLSHYALASALGVQRTFIEGIERGEPSLTLANIKMLAQRLGIDTLDLLRDDPPDGEEG